MAVQTIHQLGLLCLVLAAAAVTETTARTLHHTGRSLQQSATCPFGCVDSPQACVSDGTAAGLKCQWCQGTLLPRTIDGLCGCTLGRYYSAEYTCSSCPKGFYCPGGPVTADSQPQAIPCPGNMTTAGTRASTINACANLPGYYFTPGDAALGVEPTATPCPVDTWSAGLKKQRACAACTPGFTTGGVTAATSSNACYVAAGFYLPPGSGSAMACPQGTFKSAPGATTNCTACPGGVTTAAEGSTSLQNCTIVMASYYPIAMDGTAVTAVRRCPQRFYCPGGQPLAAVDPASLATLDAAEPTIKACPDGTWTRALEAASVEECLTPPGFYTANGNTSKCPAGSYRGDAEWVPADEATSCYSCGEGVFSTTTESIEVYDPVTEQMTNLDVMTGPTGCYVKEGQGLLVQSLDGSPSYRAVNCDSNNYGRSALTYGLEVYPCKPCPSDMVTSTDKANYPNSASHYRDNGDGTGGFVNVKACVTKAGFGYDSRNAQPCAQGFYNNKDTLTTCTQCGFGFTTEGPGAGVTKADCRVAPGFGIYNNRPQRCPVGTYADSLRDAGSSSTVACTECPAGTTTLADNCDSINDCAVCKAGFGGEGCATPCGGVGAAASYGPVGRPIGSQCTPCAAAVTGYSFILDANTNDVFAPRPVAPIGAKASMECLAEYVQGLDNTWFLPYSGSAGMVTTQGVAKFADCAAMCQQDCVFFTYNYQRQACSIKTYSAPELEGASFIAFKTEMSGDVGASSVQRTTRRIQRAQPGADSTTQAKALSSGQYVFYQDAAAASIGLQTPAPGASAFTTISDCLEACDNDNTCVAWVVDMTVSISARPQTCKFVKGDTRPGQGKRSMIRSDLTRLQAPVRLLQ